MVRTALPAQSQVVSKTTRLLGGRQPGDRSGRADLSPRCTAGDPATAAVLVHRDAWPEPPSHCNGADDRWTAWPGRVIIQALDRSPGDDLDETRCNHGRHREPAVP